MLIILAAKLDIIVIEIKTLKGCKEAGEGKHEYTRLGFINRSILR